MSNELDLPPWAGWSAFNFSEQEKDAILAFVRLTVEHDRMARPKGAASLSKARERLEFEKWLADPAMPWDTKYSRLSLADIGRFAIDAAWRAWEARAALAERDL